MRLAYLAALAWLLGPVAVPGVPAAEPVDAGVVDAGAADAGPVDAGAPDAGPPAAGATPVVPVAPIAVVAVGDVNLGTSFPSEEFLPPDGGAALLEPVRQQLAGDVVFGNLEGPLLDGGQTDKCGRSSNCYAFRTPTAYGAHLKRAGFSVMSVANNHALDFGPEGRESSLRVLDALGIAHSGPVGDIARLEVRGRKLALLAFTTADHSYNLLDIEASVAAVRAAAETADLVIVSFHGGAEGARADRVPDAMEHLGKEPRGHLVQFAHRVIDAGADLVIGHGPHLLRGMEVYRGRLIAYSLGNFCTYGRFNLTGPLGRAVVLRAELDPQTGALRGGRLQAVVQHKPGGPEPDPTGAGIEDVRRLSAADFPYSSPDIAPDGHFGSGPGAGAGLFTLAEAGQRAALRQLLDGLAERGLAVELLRRAFGDERAALDERVPLKFARPAEKVLTYEQYRAIFLQDKLLAAGRDFLTEQAELLSRVEERFGVERAVLAGIIATETRFGKHRGEFPALNALATQALRMPRRQRWATKELASLLRVFGDDPLAVTGSYAGAVGLVQFMPSSIERFGVDFDGDGRIDLDGWPDALASEARYLAGSGWRKGKPIRRGGPNYRAIWAYNPAHHYVRVVAELAEAFGLGGPPEKAEPVEKAEPAEKAKPAEKAGGAG